MCPGSLNQQRQGDEEKVSNDSCKRRMGRGRILRLILYVDSVSRSESGWSDQKPGAYPESCGFTDTVPFLEVVDVDA